MRLKRFYIAVLVIVLTVAGVTPAFAEKVTITYWWSWAGPMVEAMRKMVDKFNETYPNIEVKMTYTPIGGALETYEKLQTAIAGGAPPDAAHFERSYVDQWAAKNLLLSLDDYLTPEERAGKDFFPAAWEEVVYKGKIYAIPLDTDIRGLFWNKDLFKTAGLPDRAPETLAELDEFAEKLTKFDEKGKIENVGFVPWFGNWFFPGWSWTFGGKLADREMLEVTANDPKNVQALEWVTSYAEKYGVQAIASFSAGFTGGINNPFYMEREAMEANGIWMVGDAKRYAPELNYDVAPVPHPPGGANGTWCGGFCNIVPKGAKHPQEAAEFIKWLGQYEAQMDVYRLLEHLPTNKKALEEIKPMLDPKEEKLLAQLPVAHGRLPLWGIIFEECIATVDEAIYGRKTPKQALDDMQTRLERTFKEFFAE